MAEKKFKETKKAHKEMLKTQTKVIKDFGVLGIKAARDEAKVTQTGKTTVSPMAKARGRILGSGLGGMFGVKNR